MDRKIWIECHEQSSRDGRQLDDRPVEGCDAVGPRKSAERAHEATDTRRGLQHTVATIHPLDIEHESAHQCCHITGDARGSIILVDQGTRVRRRKLSGKEMGNLFDGQSTPARVGGQDPAVLVCQSLNGLGGQKIHGAEVQVCALGGAPEFTRHVLLPFQARLLRSTVLRSTDTLQLKREHGQELRPIPGHEVFKVGGRDVRNAMCTHKREDLIQHPLRRN